MSLIHWWPLSGNTQDKITGRSGTLKSGGVVSGAGKIGQCYSSNNNHNFTSATWSCADGIEVLNSSLVGEVGDEYSFACWIKVHGKHGQYQTCIMSSGDWNQGNCWVIGFDQNNTAIFCPVNNYNKGRINLSSALVSNQWYHLATVYKNGVSTAYLNGTKVGEVSAQGIYQSSSTTAYIGRDQAHGGFFPFNGDINDLRIYDHALSQAEIKELSKALVVHYTFDDVLVEPTTNVSTVSGWSTYSSYWTISERTETGLKLYRHTGSTSDCVAIQNSAVTSKMAQGDIWTFSCYLYKNGEPWKSTASGISSESYGYKTVSWESRDNGYYRITFQVISSPGTWVLHNYFFSPIDKGVDCEMRYMQLEKKDHATPYTPTNREGMLVNETGYSGNGTLYNSSISTDTASGSLSCHTPRINPNSINTMVNTTNAAYIYADIFGCNHTPTEFTVAWWWKVMDWGYGTGPFGLVTSNGNYMDSTLGVHDGAVYVNFAGGNTRVSRGFTGGGTGKWTHFAITFKPGSYTSYINGANQGTASTDASLTLDPWRYLYLGAGCAGGCLRDGDIYWGDFRYYNTCLTDNDIADLYKTKAYITDKEDIMCGEFVEDKTDIMVTEKSTFECKEIYELPPYIETNGSVGYFDTQYIPTSNDYSIEVDVRIKNFSSFDTLAGFMYTSTTTPRCGIHIYSSKYMFGANATTNATTPLPEDDKGGERITLKARFKSGAQQLYRNGVLIAANTTSFNHSSNCASIWLLSRNNYTDSSSTSTAVNATRVELYGAKIYEGTEEVRNYVPWYDDVLKTNCLYETHTNTVIVGQGVLNSAFDKNEKAKFYNDGKISCRQMIEI